jgi:DNA-dependent RNA polymerase auxiliary subunit epsilon
MGDTVAVNKQLVEQYNTILFKANANTVKFYSPTDSGFTRIGYELADRQDPKALIVADSESWQLSNEQIVLLGKLYLRLQGSDKRTLRDLVIYSFPRSSGWSKYSGYLFTFMAHYDDVLTAFNCAYSNLAIDEIGVNTVQCVSNFLRYESRTPTDEEIEHIVILSIKKRQEIIGSDPPRPTVAYTPTPVQVATDRIRSSLTRVIQQGQEIKYVRLKQALLSDSNLEVNQDRRILTSEMSRLGFGVELVKSLEHAEAEYRKADSTFDFKTCADHNRSFFDVLLWEAATKVAAIKKEPLNARQSVASEVRNYLKSSGFFSERLHKLSEAFYQFASEQSTHTLTAGREVARIVRNVNIELGLLIVRRLDEFGK